MWRLALLLCIIGLPAPAFAWRQTQSCLLETPPALTYTPFCVGDERPKMLRWPTNEVHYAINERGSDNFPTADGLIDPALRDAIDASFATWTDVDCSPFTFVSDGLTSTSEWERSDGINVVVFQDDEWLYSREEIAATTITATLDGVITNADVELNGAYQEFAIVTSNSSDWDVQNTVTHEAGHILGLDHDAVEGSTMEYNAPRGETRKRDLSADDIEGLCTIYPSSEPFEPMEPDDQPMDDGCCATTKSAPSTKFLALALLAMVLRRRSPR